MATNLSEAISRERIKPKRPLIVDPDRLVDQPGLMTLGGVKVARFPDKDTAVVQSYLERPRELERHTMERGMSERRDGLCFLKHDSA